MSFAPPHPPPPVAAGLMAAGQPPPPHHIMAAAAAKRPLQILLTNVPAFLHGARPLRSWLLAGGGGVRSIVLVPQQQQPPETNRKDDPKTHEEEEDRASNKNTGAVVVTALVTMSHADAALKVITAFRHFHQKLKDETGNDDTTEQEQSSSYLTFAAHAVPSNPDIPLPPALMDRETVTVLGTKLYEAFQEARETGGKETEAMMVSSANRNSNNNNNAGTSTITDENKNVTDTTTVDAGDDVMMDDDGADPLTSPAVLEAVRKFREQLTVQQGSKAVRRQQLVQEALERALPTVRQRVREERQRGTAAADSAPPPPPPGAAPLPPPPAAEGPRGVSNKPAWMTQQEQQQPPPPPANNNNNNNNDQPPTKKIKIDDVLSDAVFPPIPPDAPAATALRSFVTDQIRHYLGSSEAEAADLIDFVCQHVLAQKPVAALMVADVLEDDAPAFVRAVYAKSRELSGE